jgi:hypothetical protein
LKPFKPLSAGRWIAKPTGLLDRLRSGVILTGKAQHRPAHAEAGLLRGGGHPIPFVPGCMMGVATRNLNHVNTEPIEKRLQFGNARHL